MCITATTNPSNWKPGEAMVWRAMEAATDYELEAAKEYSEKLDDLLKFADGLLGRKTTSEESDSLSMEARMALHRIRGENVRMSPTDWAIGLGELAKKGLIVRKRNGWREA